MSSLVTYPVQVLREHITQLEAAISVSLADPGHKPVHKLRTETRRVEALLLLLAMTPGLPEHREEAATLLRALAKLRRAAGQVRDLDVHRKMLQILVDAAKRPTAGAYPADTQAGNQAHKRRMKPGANSTSRTAPQKATTNAVQEPEKDPAELSNPATQLRKHMGRQRKKAAIALQDLLERRQTNTAKAAEALLDVLKPAEELELPAQDLLREAQAVLTRDGPLNPADIAGFQKKELHTVRKAAKAARYIAEALTGDPALTEAARHFEALQEAGGQWHDTLELAKAARHHFGNEHELTAFYRRERDEKLEAYRAALDAEARDPVSAGKKRATKKAPRKRAVTA